MNTGPVSDSPPREGSEADGILWMPVRRHVRPRPLRVYGRLLVMLGMLAWLTFAIERPAEHSFLWWYLLLQGGLPLLILLMRTFPLRAWHVLSRVADGRVRLERQWWLGSRRLSASVVDIDRHTWLRVKAPDGAAVILEFGNRNYLNYALSSVVSLDPQAVLTKAEIEAAKAELLALGRQVAQMTGVENRGFREYS